MVGPRLDPGQIRKPIQLLGIMIAGLVLLVGMYLAAAERIEKLGWRSAMFSITAVAIVPIFLGVVILMWTRFRVQFQDDPYYAEWLRRQEGVFHDFKAEYAPSPRFVAQDTSSTEATHGEELRIRRYQENEGVFLIHHWRPSMSPGQVADIVIELAQHREGPLSAGQVESVTYYLGPMFFHGKPVVKRDAHHNFRLEISAYSPVLCLAEMRIRGRRDPSILERYVDFDA